GHRSTGSAPFRLASVSPVDQSTGVPSDATVSVRFSAPVAPRSPTPTLTPPVAGSWQRVTPDTFMFVPAAPLVPSSAETVSIPGGDGGITSASGRSLAAGVTAHFTVAPGSTLRLQQLLAQLGYLPVSFTPAGQLSAAQETAEPQQGSFSWRAAEPASLVGL